MAFTEDGLPCLDELPGKAGVYLATGCNGHGLGWSMSLGKLAAGLVLGRSEEAGAKDGDLAIFSLSRFREKSPV